MLLHQYISGSSGRVDLLSFLPDSQLVDVWSPADSAKWGEKLGPSTNVYLTDDGTVCCPHGCCHILCSTQAINSIHPQRAGGGTVLDRYAVLETEPPLYHLSISEENLRANEWE